LGPCQLVAARDHRRLVGPLCDVGHDGIEHCGRRIERWSRQHGSSAAGQRHSAHGATRLVESSRDHRVEVLEQKIGVDPGQSGTSILHAQVDVAVSNLDEHGGSVGDRRAVEHHMVVHAV
jgi:hypothetical protein